MGRSVRQRRKWIVGVGAGEFLRDDFWAFSGHLLPRGGFATVIDVPLQASGIIQQAFEAAEEVF
jgi:hypothetical protein